VTRADGSVTHHIYYDCGTSEAAATVHNEGHMTQLTYPLTVDDGGGNSTATATVSEDLQGRPQG
jgi:hypothetical protein